MHKIFVVRCFFPRHSSRLWMCMCKSPSKQSTIDMHDAKNLCNSNNSCLVHAREERRPIGQNVHMRLWLWLWRWWWRRRWWADCNNWKIMILLLYCATHLNVNIIRIAVISYQNNIIVAVFCYFSVGARQTFPYRIHLDSSSNKKWVSERKKPQTNYGKVNVVACVGVYILCVCVFAAFLHSRRAFGFHAKHTKMQKIM